MFNSQDAAYSNDVSYAGILAEAELVSAGSERGRLFLQCSDGGALVNTMTLKGKLVGLGIDEPAGQFHVKGNDTTDQIIIENETNSSTTAPDLVLYKSGTIGVGHQPGRIDFRGRNGLNNANVTYSAIISEVEGTSNLSEGGAIKFFTTQSGTLTEAARINSAGNFKPKQKKVLTLVTRLLWVVLPMRFWITTKKVLTLLLHTSLTQTERVCLLTLLVTTPRLVEWYTFTPR